ncbi:MAG: phosphoribosylanthranilate isomerase [Rikenellaceae bacterium]
MIVKVCGMREAQNVADVAALHPTMMGFIFYAPSSRYVGDSVPMTPNGVKRVGVFVNASVEEILERVERHSLDVVQLHGAEPVAQCEQLRGAGVEVVKAISVAAAEDVVCAALYDGHVDWLLFDTKCVGYGGSGVSFDWGVLDEYRGDTPFLLSGGVDETMVADICGLRHASFVGVDLNSRFELSPAMKDVARLEQFIKRLK